MKIIKILLSFVPHAATIISVMMITFDIIHMQNDSMEFLTGSMTRTLMVFWIISIAAVCVLHFLSKPSLFPKLVSAGALALCDLAMFVMWIYNQTHLTDMFFGKLSSEIFVLFLSVLTIFTSALLMHTLRTAPVEGAEDNTL